MYRSTLCLLFLALVGVSVAQNCYQARVLGAGVIGLTSAIQLQKLGFNVTIHAYASPLENTNYSYYASPHAGAWWSGNWNVDSYPSYSALMGLVISEPLSTAYYRTASVYYASFPSSSASEVPSGYADYFRNLTAAELSAIGNGTLFTYGYQMNTVIVDAPVYIQWLMTKFLASGGNIIHQNVTKLSDLTNLPSTDLVINSPGLGALWLGDVMDTNMYPQRGQTLIVRNPSVTQIYRARSPVDNTDPGNYGTYILPRYNGEIVVGGTRQDGDWNTDYNATDDVNILGRAKVLCPDILNYTLVKHNVGLRPGRVGGTRVQLDNVNFTVPVIHHYGHAGSGFEESYGSTARVMAIVQQLFPSLSTCPVNPPSPSPSPSPASSTTAPTCAPTPVTPTPSTTQHASAITSSASRMQPWWRLY